MEETNFIEEALKHILYPFIYICFMVLIGLFILTVFHPIDQLAASIEKESAIQPEQVEEPPALAQTIIDLQTEAEQAKLLAEQQAAELKKEQESLHDPGQVGKQYAWLSIERISMRTAIYYGDDKATLRKGPGQYAGSDIPGGGSQILIAGHNTTHFKPLQQVVIGDKIRVVTNYGEFNYEVTDIVIASMNDRTTYNFDLDYEQLVLYTCYPFSGPPGKTQRYFVYADLIQ